MNFWVMPVRLPAIEAVVTAPPSDVFEWVTSFTKKTTAGGSRVLSTAENGDLICEFVSVVFGLLGRRKVHRTVERVTLEPPTEMRFQGCRVRLPFCRIASR